MLESLVNPVLRRAFRPWPAVAMMAIAILIAARGRMPGMLTLPIGVCGGFCLSFGLPRAALRLIEWDRSGQLDQLRLAGWAPSRLIASMLIGGALPWMAAGAAILGFWAVLEDSGHILAFGILPLSVASATLAVVALALPRGQALDPRIAATGLSVFLFMSSAILSTMPADVPARFAARFGLSAPGLVGLGVVAALSVVALCLPRVILMGLRPSTPSLALERSFGWLSRLPISPLLTRGVRQHAMPSLALTAASLIGIALIARVQGTVPNNLAVAGWMLSLSHLAVGAIAISISCRGDFHAGRFDIERTAARPAWLNMVSVVVGSWAPYLIGWSIMNALALWLWTEPLRRLGFGQYLEVPAIAILIMAPWPLVEGWNGAWLGSFGAIGFLTLPFLMQNEIAFVLLLGWVSWAVAAETMAAGPGIVRSRSLACAIAAGTGATLAMSVPNYAHTTYSMFAMIQLGDLLSALVAVHILFAACVEPLPTRFFANLRFRMTVSIIVFAVIGGVLIYRTSVVAVPLLAAATAVVALWAGHGVRLAVGRPGFASQLIAGAIAVIVPMVVSRAAPVTIFVRRAGFPARLSDAEIEWAYARQFLITIAMLIAVTIVALIARAISNKFRPHALGH